MTAKKEEIEKYVMVEINERNFILAQKVIGCDAAYHSLGTFRNRNQASKILDVLNGVKK